MEYLTNSIKTLSQAHMHFAAWTHWIFDSLNSSDLQAMNFKPGEIIDLKDAIEEWAVKIS
jgi:hypothetical protein